MLIKTTFIGIKALLYLGLEGGGEPVTPRRIAESLDISPTYLAKVTNLLVRANILRSHRGALGGVTLSRPVSSISLLEIVEALQGQLVGDYCRESEDLGAVCAFHKSMYEVHRAIVEVLSRWTLADLIARPAPDRELGGRDDCRMAGIDSLVAEMG